MNETPGTIDALPLEVRNRLEALLLQFDQSWSGDALKPTIETLPADDPTFRRVALIELIKIDLERHWQQGTRKLLEDYVVALPELGGSDGVPAELVAAECVVRQQFGDQVRFSTITERFPRQAEEAKRLIEQARSRDSGVADRQSSRDTAIQSGDTHSVVPYPATKQSSGPDHDRMGTSGADTVASPRQQPPPELSGTFGRYSIERLLGKGAMGAVYLAEDTRLNRRVAIKTPVFSGEKSDELIRRFHREARSSATLQHPGICPVYDVDEIDGQHYLSMAYIEGHPLSDFIRPGSPVPIRAAALLVRRIALALEHAHANGVVHRDLKPANIMVNERKEPLVMDFGLALMTDADEESRVTHKGAILGTPAYMSPEQVNGEQESIGPPTDIYSLGVILYELLTGQLPFRGKVIQVIGRILSSDPPDLCDLRPDVDPELKTICGRMMAKSPADRYASMQEVADALTNWVRDREPQHTTAAGDAEETDKVEFAVRPLADISEMQEIDPQPVRSWRVPQARPQDIRPRQTFRNQMSSWLLRLGGGLFALLVLLGVTLLFRTPEGTLRIEVNDPEIEVLVDEQAIELTDSRWEGRKKARLHRLGLRLNGAGIPFDENTQQFVVSDGRLIVKLGEVELHGRHFEVTRRGKTVLQVSLKRDNRHALAAGTPPSSAEPPSLAIAPFDARQARLHQEAWAEYLGVPVEKTVDLPGGVKLPMVLIPPGEFMMGITQQEFARFTAEAREINDTGFGSRAVAERPRHRVRISQPFYVGKYELTQAQWVSVMGHNPSSATDDLAKPVEQVSWDDVSQFLEKLHATLPHRELYFSLPTEAQWEYACRAGTTSIWCCGDDALTLHDYGWFCDNAQGAVHPVGQLQPNNFGLHDMHGNVWEWCFDFLRQDYYSRSPTVDPLGPSAGAAHVTRGGCWQDRGRAARSARRHGNEPHHYHRLLGFRLAASIISSSNASDSHPPGTAGKPVERLTPTEILLSDDWVWTEPVNLGPRVNGSQFDAYPSLTADGLAMYFMSDRGEFGRNPDIVVSRRPTLNSPFGRPERLGDTVNSSEAELYPCISSDGLELFFARHAEVGDQHPVLYVSRRSSASEEFGRAEALGPGVNSVFGGTHPAISPDHLTIFFASRRSTHPSDFELYRASRPDRDAPFNTAVRLRELSSPGDDHYPRFTPDGGALLFSSTRAPTNGYGDIWIARRQTDGTFDSPVRCNGGINTRDLDGSVALSPDGMTAIFHRGNNNWFDLWTTSRVRKADASGSREKSTGERPPDYSVFAGGDWEPVFDSKKELGSCSVHEPDANGGSGNWRSVGEEGVQGVTLTDDTLRLEGRDLMLNGHRSQNLIIRATVNKLSGWNLSMGVRWPGVRTSLSLFTAKGYFGAGSQLHDYRQWSESVHTHIPYWVTEFEFALARIDRYIWVYVDGRRILELEIEEDLPECMPVLSAYRGASTFRNVEVQILDDDIAERVKLP